MRISDWSSDVCSSDLLLPTREFARRPFVWLNLISRNRGTLAYSPSFGYELCARRAETASIEGIDLSSWRVAGIGGDMIRPHILSRLSDRFAPSGFQAESFVASYGMAEVTLALSRSEEHTSELQSLMRTSYAVFC